MSSTHSSSGVNPASIFLSAVVALVAVTILAPTSSWAGSGECVSARVDQPMRFPGGDLRPAGRLTLCERVLSPVSNLHRTYVDGRPVAMLISRTSTAEGGSDADAEMFFKQGADGHLELIGYVVPAHGRSVTFSFDGKSPRRQATVERDAVIVAATR